MRFRITTSKSKQESFSIPLIGAHQIDNAAIVVKCVELLNHGGVKISRRSLKTGLQKSRWPARFQKVCRQPEIILDVAHNPEGARALVKTFRTVYPGKKVILVCGFLERPDYDLMLQEFATITQRAVITRPVSDRAAEIEGVIWATANAGIDFDVQLTVSTAVERALKLSAGRQTILICGSHYTVGEAITRLQSLHGKGQLKLVSADITFRDG